MPLEQAVRVVSLLVEGVGIRAASRLTGLHQQTVLNILGVAGEKCEALLKERIRGIEAANVEVDELYSYVGVRPENAHPSDYGRGEVYCYLATDRNSKLIISHVVGKRGQFNCVVLMADLKSRLHGRTQLSTDGYGGYLGQQGAVFKTFGEGIDYGTEIKEYGRAEGPEGRYRPAICLGATRKARIGQPDLHAINTSRVERLNLTVRHFTRRFTRSTLGYSKIIRNHRHAVRLFIAHFNFCRCHSSLKNGIARTPAMAAGITDHVWTIEELLRRD